jgi:acetolactate synthase-1/2/3 large subunit
MMTTVADQLAAALAARGVRHAFGMPGGSTVPLLAAFDREGIRFCLVRHEGAAGFMADAAYQVTGAPGVCVSTLGPGATNLLTGVTGAFLERSRVLAIAGQCGADLQPVYTHQIIDQLAMFRPVTRHADALRAPTATAQISLALRVLDQQRPGPVYLELPTDVARAPAPLPVWRDTPASQGLPDLSAAQALLDGAHRPVVFVGCGDLRDEVAAALARFAEAGVPVLSTYRAKGMLDEDSPWSIGAAGLSPRADALQQRLLAQADLVILLGMDPVELRPEWLPGWPAEIPTISIDPYGQPDLLIPLAADLRGDPARILDGLRGKGRWEAGTLAAHRAAVDALFEDAEDGPASTIRAVQRALDGQDAVVALDVGAHRITASHVWCCERPRRLLQSNGFSSMGVGLPMAIGAKLSRPERPVIALTGDMGLWMVAGELGTAAELGLDLVVVYLADDTLSLIALKQERGEGTGGGVRFTSPDPRLLAAAYGGTGHIARGAAAVEAAVRTALQAGGLHLIEARIDPAAYRQQM